ncbi:MAG: addiction module protein [Planctomycetaceae bacterium]|jgi:putative addiction module component (TIGR02574 family)|nr:addiction module protein [Planctomycetaceae bacterium]
MSSVPADLRLLPVAERISLVEALWETIADDQTELDLTEAQKAELDRRLVAREGRSAASPWEDVKRRILGK